MSTTNRFSGPTLRRAALLAAGAGLIVALPLLAQSAAPSGQNGGFDRPLGGQPPAPRGKASADGETSVVITSIEDGKSYSVRMHNNEVSAEVDGKPVPPERIDRKGDVIIIKDADGNTIKTFDVAVGQGRATRWRTNAPDRWVVTPQVPGNTYSWTTPPADQPEPPPVMVGITMSGLTGPLAEHLGLKENEAFVIDRVVDELPASKAGVEPLDVVIAIDGEKPATQDRLREVLRSKKPGESMALTIIRKGKEKKIEIELAAYDRSKLGTPGSANAPWITTTPGEGGQVPWVQRWTAPDHDELRKHLEQALKSLNQSDTQVAERELNEALRAVREEAERSAQRNRMLVESLGDRSVILGGDQGQFFAMPGDREINRRLEKLGDQLERLNRRLEEIEKRLSEK